MPIMRLVSSKLSLNTTLVADATVVVGVAVLFVCRLPFQYTYTHADHNTQA